MTATMKTALCLLVLSCCGPLLASAVLSEVPSNVVGYVGDTIQLNCAITPGTTGTRVVWTEFASNSGGSIVSSDKSLIESHPNRANYELVGDANQYYLLIKNLRLADGGTYLCQDINSGSGTFRGFAEVIVLQDDPVCQDFVTVTGNVIEGNSYSSECELQYKGNIAPRMEWTGPGEYSVNSSTTTTAVWAWKRFTAHRSIEGGQFNCHTDFAEVTGMPPEHATNRPDYTHHYAGPILNVQWAPTDLQVSPIKPQYDVGDILTCSCDSKPPATFVWTNMELLVPEEPSPFFTITSGMAGRTSRMRCQATAIIEGTALTQDIFHDVTVPAATTTTTPGQTTPTTPPPADGPCKDFTGQWRSTNPNAILCVEMDSRGNLLTLIRNGTDPYFIAGNGKTVVDDYRHIGFTGIWPTGDGVGGFTGECHSCYGDEVILLSGLSRNKAEAPGCGESAGTHLIRLYVLTRSGPPCRGMELDVYNPKPWVTEKMGIKVRPYIP